MKAFGAISHRVKIYIHIDNDVDEYVNKLWNMAIYNGIVALTYLILNTFRRNLLAIKAVGVI